MTRLVREVVSGRTRQVAQRVHGMTGDVRERTHLVGDALLARRPRRAWLATVGIFVLGVAGGVVAAIATLRRTLLPPEPAMTGTEDKAPHSASAVPLETVGAERSQ